MPLINHSRPILFLHPDPAEARALQKEIGQAAVDHPILHFPEAGDARDYLNAVLLAQAAGEHYCPCLVFFDEAMPPEEVAGFRRWTASRPELAGIHFIKLSSDAAVQPAETELPSKIARRPAQALLRRLVARACLP